MCRCIFDMWYDTYYDMVRYSLNLFFRFSTPGLRRSFVEAFIFLHHSQTNPSEAVSFNKCEY